MIALQRRVCHSRPLQWVSEKGIFAITRRMIMTESVEPPPTSTVPERPCDLVLAQDPFYETSWQETFAQILPHERGLHYCSISVGSKNLRGGLDVLEQDLSSLMNIVFVARGPLMSLIAQYYLESLPLAGLVMVDPILPDHVDVLHKLENLLDRDTSQHEFVKGLISGEEVRPLKLEPGAVPMLILQSLQDEVFREASKDVARRHKDDSFIYGEVPVHDISSNEAEVCALQAIDVITEWIDDSVL